MRGASWQGHGETAAAAGSSGGSAGENVRVCASQVLWEPKAQPLAGACVCMALCARAWVVARAWTSCRDVTTRR